MASLDVVVTKVSQDVAAQAQAKVAWPVRAARLALRPVDIADLEALWHYRRLPDVQRWLSRAHDHDSFAATLKDRTNRAHLLVAVMLDDRMIGDIVIMIENGWAQADVAEQAVNMQAELGWAFDPDVAGQGYATEALEAVLSLCFVDLGLRRVHAGCFTANTPSWRLMERVGMRRESAGIRDGLHRSGGWMDGYEYAILGDEWEPAAGQRT